MRAIKNIGDIFLLFLLVVAFYFVYVVFKPFIWVILVSVIIAVIFYPLYEIILKWVKGRKNLAALLMTLLIILLVVAPISNFVVVLSKKSIDTYNLIQDRFTNGDLIEQVEAKFRQLENYLSFVNPESFKDVVLNYSSQLNSFLISSTAGFIRGTTQFVTNLFLIILTLFFFFRDGERLVKRLMQLTPLSNKYDRQIFKDFHNISYSTIVSSFVTAIAQGIVGGLGFYLVGIPAFFLGVAMAFASLIPVGSAIIWL